MVQLSLSEKLKILVDVSKSSGISIISILLLLFIAFLFLTTNKKNAKNSIKLYRVIYIMIVITFLAIYHASLSTMFDYMMNNFFIGFYFPNLAIYLAAIILTNIILLKTIFNFKEDKLLKVINTTVFCLIHYILVLILGLVNANKIDVFNQASVYQNNDVSGLIGLSSTIFIVWIIFITIYKIIRANQKKHQKVKIPVRRIIRYKKKLPANYLEVDVPQEVHGTFGIPREKGVYVKGDLLDFYKNENEELTKQYDSMFTLADYKRMVEILRNDQKEESNNQTLVIDNSKEQEEVKLERLDDENDEIQSKLEELLNLYKSV